MMEKNLKKRYAIIQAGDFPYKTAGAIETWLFEDIEDAKEFAERKFLKHGGEFYLYEMKAVVRIDPEKIEAAKLVFRHDV